MDRPPLWQHQKEALAHGLKWPGFGLFMDMGTGKTRTAIEFLERRGSKRALVVGSEKSMPVWERSLFELCGDDIEIVPLRMKVKDRALEISKTYSKPVVFITNYEGVWIEPMRSVVAYKAKLDHIVADEAHRVKTPGSRISKTFSLFGNHVPFRLALTGTPAADKPPDLYALYRFMDKRAFGTSYEDFLKRYTLRRFNGFRQEIYDYQNEDELHYRMYRIAYRVTSDEVIGLPPMIDISLPVHLDAASMRVYREMKKELITEVDEATAIANNTLTRDLRLQQITSGFIIDDEKKTIRLNHVKESALKEWLEELSEPVVVFALFIEDLEAIHRAAKAAGKTSGELSGRKNDTAASGGRFPEGIDVLAVQTQAGSESVDLTRARIAMDYSFNYSLVSYQQRRARLRRPGQNQTVRWYTMGAVGTVDESILKAVLKKQEDTDYVVDRKRG